jgi:hypothetical protein
MTFDDLLNNVRRIVEDEGLRWSDKVIGEYTVEGVNEIFRKTGSVEDVLPLDFIQGQHEYPVVLGVGRIIDVKILPENTTTPLTLLQKQVSDLPVDYSTETDPEFYALSSVTGATGDLNANQIIVFNSAPARTTTGATTGNYGVYITMSREWEFVSAEYATAFQSATVIPILPKFNRHLTNLVAGNMLIEMNDTAFVQKGVMLAETARQYLSNIAYTNSLSHYVYSPNRQYP